MNKVTILLLPVFLAGMLAGCAGQTYDPNRSDASYFFSDAPGNGHSRSYTYPTDFTRDYRSYPGDAQIANH